MRERIDRTLVTWGHFSYRHAWATIGVILAAVAALASQLPRLEFETSTEGFLHEDHPLRTTYDAFREQFGRDDQVVIAIRAPDVFAPAFLEKLRSLHDDIENEVPNLEEVSSLINARNTRGEGDQLIVGDLLEDAPETPAELAALRQLALENPLYRDLLISGDGRFATVLVRTSAYSALGDQGDVFAGFDDEGEELEDAAPRPFITGEENSAIVRALEAIIERYDDADFRIYMSGAPPMVDALNRSMQSDMVRFTALAVVTIVGFLSLLFRRLAGVVLPMVVVVLSLITTLGLMAVTGVPIMLPTQILPSFLLAVGVGYSVHILAIFYQRQGSARDEEDAIAFALGHSGLAVVMTGLTTAGGLVSFAAAELAPIADFGIFGPVGVMLALIFTLVLLPPLAAVFPMGGDFGGGRVYRDRISQRLLVRAGASATAHAWGIMLATAGLLSIALLGAFQIRFSHDPIRWFPEDHPLRISNELINEELKGAMFMEVLVDTGSENGLRHPQVLNQIDEMRRYAAGLQMRDVYVGKTVSLLEVVKETHRALNENRAEFYEIPQDPLLLAQELLLFENSGSDDLEDLVDSRFSKGRITMKLPFVDATQYRPFLDTLAVEFEEIVGDGADITITGLVAIAGGTIDAVIRSMAKTYVIALLIITPMMILLIGQLRVGLISMLPNLTPIVFALGYMGWKGIPLDAFTLLVGSIAIGLAVDDTIHFMHNFRRCFEASGDVAEAVRETLRTTGQAILFTSLVLSAGFFIYMLATMDNLFYFGFLTGSTILMAFLANLILAPALVALVARPAKSRAVSSDQLEATT